MPPGSEGRTGGESFEAFAVSEIDKLRAALDRLAKPPYPALLAAIAEAVANCLAVGGKVLFCGNGGSAADAQHLAAELVGRQNFDRSPAAGIALTVDSSALTAIANDYGYEAVFARQVAAIGRAGDVMFGLSTSGRSPNVVAAMDAGRQLGLTTVAFTGEQPRQLSGADHVLAVPATETAKIQELHITCGHIVLAAVENHLYGD